MSIFQVFSFCKILCKLICKLRLLLRVNQCIQRSLGGTIIEQWLQETHIHGIIAANNTVSLCLNILSQEELGRRMGVCTDQQ